MKACAAKLITTVVLLAAVCLAAAGAAYADEGVFLGARLPEPEPETRGSACFDVGSVAADAARHAAGAELAVLPSGLIAGAPPQGFLSREQILEVFTENPALAVAEVTPAQLRAVLENAVSHVVTDMETERIDRAASDWEGFAQVSGLVFKYDASAPVGGRIVWIKLPDGTKLDLDDSETRYSLVSTQAVLGGALGYPVFEDARTLDMTIADALEGYIAERGAEIYLDELERITAIGAGENQLVGVVSTPVLAIALAVLVVLFAALRSKPVWDEYHFEGEMK